MPESLEDLIRRSEELGGDLDSAESVRVNAAIVELDPDQIKATRRLAIGLFNTGRTDEALELIEQAAERFPDDRIIANRLKEFRARAVREKEKPVKPKRASKARAASGPITWIKALHYDEDWTVEPGQRSWVSDPGKLDGDGKRVYTAAGKPWGEPSWRVGDRVGLYFAGTFKVPILVEVADSPTFDPDLVANESGSTEDGERWPWVTPVTGLTALPLEEAPTLSDLGIQTTSMQQRARKKLDAEQADRLWESLGPG